MPPAYAPITPEILNAITAAVGPGAVVQDPEKLTEFGNDGSDQSNTPDLVVEATSYRQIQDHVREAAGCRFFKYALDSGSRPEWQKGEAGKGLIL